MLSYVILYRIWPKTKKYYENFLVRLGLITNVYYHETTMFPKYENWKNPVHKHHNIVPTKNQMVKSLIKEWPEGNKIGNPIISSEINPIQIISQNYKIKITYSIPWKGQKNSYYACWGTMIARFLPQMGQAPLLLLLRHAFPATIVHSATGLSILFKNSIKNFQKVHFLISRGWCHQNRWFKKVIFKVLEW